MRNADMKRILSIILSLTILLTFGGIQSSSLAEDNDETYSSESEAENSEDNSDQEFSGLDDPDLLYYVENTVYSDLIDQLDGTEYFVENVSATYISKEYLEEVAYNSQANIYFGYTLEELEDVFQGTKYVFTLGDDGTTTVQAFEDYDDTYDQVVRNLVVGTGVILVCVTVSVVSGGVGAPAVSMIFAASAKTGSVLRCQAV